LREKKDCVFPNCTNKSYQCFPLIFETKSGEKVLCQFQHTKDKLLSILQEILDNFELKEDLNNMDTCFYCDQILGGLFAITTKPMLKGSQKGITSGKAVNCYYFILKIY
jgi:hypothetical protein